MARCPWPAPTPAPPLGIGPSRLTGCPLVPLMALPFHLFLLSDHTPSCLTRPWSVDGYGRRALAVC